MSLIYSIGQMNDSSPFILFFKLNWTVAHIEIFIGQIHVNIKTTVNKYTAFNKIDLIFGVSTFVFKGIINSFTHR